MTFMPPLREISAALATGAISPTRLVEDALAGASKSPSVFISLLADAARSDAVAATLRWKSGQPLGPFDGIPYVVKDLFDVAGAVTTAGSRTRTSVPAAERSSALVDILSEQGLIVLGKTNLSEFAFSGLGLNPHFGTPTPGYDPGRVPGGSSSGSAIAIERGIVALALGTDTAGSMRIPAAFNRIVGFRPSQGRYDARGIFPLAASFDVPGPMATSVFDVSVLDGLMRKATPVAARQSATFMLDTDLLSDVTIQASVRTELLSLIERLEDAGVHIERRCLRSIAEARSTIAELGWLGGAEAATFHTDLLDGPDRDAVDPRVIKRLDSARSMSSETVLKLRGIRSRLIAECRSEFGDAILLSPTVGHEAPALAQMEADQDEFAAVNLATLSLTMIASFLDMPALAMPVAPGSGISLQLSAPKGADDAVISSALLLEELQHKVAAAP